MKDQQRFVADGKWRARQAHIKQVHKQVDDKYADDLAIATPLRKLFLKLIIWYEVHRILAKYVSDRSTY